MSDCNNDKLIKTSHYNTSNITPRLHIDNCVDYHVISQALFLLASDKHLEGTSLQLCAQELMDYLNVNQRLIHTEHTDTAKAAVQKVIMDLYVHLNGAQQIQTILEHPEETVIDFSKYVKGE